ncbi:sedoheptulose-7-phosphate:D-glyceraldehyde-3- phosphate transaldolase [Mucor velutinosus]|uniref:Sedoheptulose-7-phosphate:D-glyceraldehyde-3-phosphate transaldolase n=1 Tax=Mucor velutinosus TaxID=708070 RepID=A0AAN7D768_9FUNG|nr:sedoheptulose-7-phosphate:D-glyceraldehyde-3- phosphate transaldolase [Mucor velutinosus]
MWRPSVSVLKRRFGIDEDEDNEEVEEARRGMRTPSLVREDVAELWEKIQDIKSTFGAISTHSKSIIPTALKNILQKHEFADAEEILNIAETPKSKAEADAFVALVGGRFVESIDITSNGSWAFITQVEAYLRAEKK